jgi:hypothetical protein
MRREPGKIQRSRVDAERAREIQEIRRVCRKIHRVVGKDSTNLFLLWKYSSTSLVEIF